VTLDTNSHKPCCETDCTVTTCGPPLILSTELSVLTVVYYCTEKNTRYVTQLITRFILLHFVFNVLWDPTPVKILSAIAIYTLELEILE